MRLQKVYFTSYMINHFLNSDVIWLESVDSTNEEIKRRIHEFSKPTWVIAKNQLRGKGRNGNSWFSNDGNFSGSVIFFPKVKHSYLHLYGFFFGVALYNTIKKIVKQGVDIRLKWPNDLMIENGKAAGILLESLKDFKNSRNGLIIGVGVNLNSSPSLKADSKKRYETQCLLNFTNDQINQLGFFSKFNDELIKLGSCVTEKNLCSILNFWELRSYDKGTLVNISDFKGHVHTGLFLGLDQIGGLIVGNSSGVKQVYSGDVYFGS